jgi:DNA (cytosine-5)-methyltransferase 1
MGRKPISAGRKEGDDALGGESRRLAVVDLFSGIGGFTLGLERTGGFQTVLFCETDEYCRMVLAKHWPSVPIHTDIRTLTGKKIETLVPKIDLLCGGFPCQDISVAGKRAGLGGRRSGLWWELFRLICEARPPWLLIENVPNLRTRGADRILAVLEGEAYACWPTVVGAWALGAPHKRDRVWILGHAKHHGLPAFAVARSVEKAILYGEERADQASKPEGASASRMLPERALAGSGPGHLWPAGWGEGQHKWEAPRIAEPGVGGAVDGIRSRLHRLRALGNAVVPGLPELFGKFILAAEASRGWPASLGG